MSQHTELNQYRKKPVVITAVQWFKDGDHPSVIRKAGPNRHADEGIPWCPTLEGGHVVTPGDWIITGVKGEHYPCKPDIFALTYEAAADYKRARAFGSGWQVARLEAKEWQKKINHSEVPLEMVKTEAQEREEFEAEFDQLCKDYSIYGTMEARLCKVFFEAGRAGRKV